MVARMRWGWGGKDQRPTEDVGNGVHCADGGVLAAAAALGGQHHGGQDGLRLLQEGVHGVEAGLDALGQGASHLRVVAAHGLQDEADVTDGSPLDGDLSADREAGRVRRSQTGTGQVSPDTKSSQI